MKKKVIGVSVPEGFVDKVKAYQKENFLPSFSATIVILVFKSLEKEKNK